MRHDIGTTSIRTTVFVDHVPALIFKFGASGWYPCSARCKPMPSLCRTVAKGVCPTSGLPLRVVPNGKQVLRVCCKPLCIRSHSNVLTTLFRPQVLSPQIRGSKTIGLRDKAWRDCALYKGCLVWRLAALTPKQPKTLTAKSSPARYSNGHDCNLCSMHPVLLVHRMGLSEYWLRIAAHWFLGCFAAWCLFVLES